MIQVSPVSSVAARIGRDEFLAPEMWTVPLSVLPPCTRSLSMVCDYWGELDLGVVESLWEGCNWKACNLIKIFVSRYVDEACIMKHLLHSLCLVIAYF